MYPPNDRKILGLLKPTDVVLDIGGWACPFNRADYVLDAEPYEQAVQTHADAGFDHIVQMNAGPDPDGILDFFQKDLHDRLQRL